MEKKRYQLIVEPITCVHIGTGEQLTPLDYYVAKTGEGKHLYCVYDSDSILKRIATDKDKFAEFEKLTSQNNMRGLVDFFHKNISTDDIKYPCDVAKEFLDNYDKNKNIDPLENGRFVQAMYRPAGKKTPVIPGSSIKGAIRTAVLNDIMFKLTNENYDQLYDDFKNEKKKENFDKTLQNKLLNYDGDAKSDPFRSLEISDIQFDAKGTQVVGALSMIKNNKHTKELEVCNESQILLEMIKGKLLGSSVNASGIIRINSALNQTKQISQSIDLKQIINACKYFYWQEFENEYKTFYREATDKVDEITKLKKELQAIKDNENEFFIRVGRYSQVEFITYEENFREPKTPVIKGKQMSYGTTRTVLNFNGQYLPLGWCKCTVKEEISYTPPFTIA